MDSSSTPTAAHVEDRSISRSFPGPGSLARPDVAPRNVSCNDKKGK